jgi:hypothetical protein
MARFAVPVLAFVAAVMTASLLGSIAHYGLGITRGDIRIDALGAVGFIALGLAGSTLLKRNK